MTKSQLRLRVKPGRQDELLVALDRLEVFAAVRELSGFLGASVLVSDDDSEEVLVEGSWASVEHFERWRESSWRAEWLRSLEPLLAAEPVARTYHVVDSIG
jgi:quinol monooxygenase YgiN